MLGNLHIHREKGKQNICIFSTRRSGSTLLMQMISSQPGINYVDQPFDLGKYNPYKQSMPNMSLSKFIHLNEQQQVLLRNYFQDVILKGRLKGYSEWNYFRNSYNFMIDRYVIKILNAMPLMDWFSENFNVKILYLVRHPIPVSLSIIKRTWGNTAEAFLHNPHFTQSHMNERLIRFSSSILENGTKLQKFVLEWCLENLYPLFVVNKRKCLTITYEELVLRPRQMVNLICEYLNLPNREKMLSTKLKPSINTSKRSKKDIKTRSPSYLVNRWKKEIDEESEAKAMGILEEFGIDAYEKGSTVPSSKLTHFGSIEDDILES